MKVLLVDDHAIFRESLRDLLTTRHITVIGEAQDGYEALKQTRALHPDLILMDIQMPGCDGLMATRLIKAEMPEIKIVILTMTEDDASIFEAIKSGAVGYLVKRAGVDEFLTLFADLEEGRAPLSPGLADKVFTEFARLARVAEQTRSAEPMDSTLTQRQRQVLMLLVQGKSYQDIGEVLGLSGRTIKYHTNEIIKCLHLANRAEVIAYALRHGLGGTRPT